MKAIYPILFVMLCVAGPVVIAWLLVEAKSFWTRTIALMLYAAILHTLLKLSQGAP